MIRKLLERNLLVFISADFNTRTVAGRLCVVPFALSLFFSAFCFSQPVLSPAVKCVAVNPANGDVTLTWAIPAGPGAFLNYKIYSSAAQTGPFTQVGTVNTFTATTFTHTGAGANLARIFYKVQTEYDNPPPTLSAPIDTFSTIFLQVSAGVGTASLSWNKISIQNIATSTGKYKIYREYPAGNWVLRDSTTSLSYTDIIDVCSAVMNYRVEIADNSGCISVSNVAGGMVFSDQTEPTNSPIDTVSVDPVSSLATISWSNSVSADADSVVIYKFAAGWNRIDAVAVPQTSYTYSASQATNVSELFRLAVKDSCGNISPLGIYHKTIYLSVSFNICAATADLIWNKYVNWTPGVSQYEIWKSTGTGPLTLIGTNAPSDTSFLDTGLVLGTPYCYVIHATNGTKTSSSNRVCFSPSVTQPPAYTYQRYATVTSNTTIDLKAHVDFSSSVKYYRIQRAKKGGAFSVILAATLPTAGTINYTDNKVNTTTGSYVYKIDAMDSCGHVIESTNFDTTIFLTATVAPNLDVILNWSDYGSFDAGVIRYNIYRAVDGVWSGPIGSVNYTGSGGTFTDDVAPYLSSLGGFSYYVVAIEDNGNTFGFTDSSASNIATVDHYPKFYIPNAFTPNGDNLNDVFLPMIGFVDPANYSLMIFDRTGTPVFESRSPAEGWDGKKKGDPCQAGVYMYLVKCYGSSGEESRISGTISLFR